MNDTVSLRFNGVDSKVEGFYKVAIVDSATDKVVWEMPEFEHNLILNGGMDLVASTRWSDLFLYGIVGTGTRPNSIDSGATNASQGATTVTASGGSINFTTDAAVGDVIKWDGGATANVVSITDSTHLVADVSQTVGSGHFIIWKTAQTGLQTETRRSNTYLTGSGNCGSTIVSNAVQLKRTIDFPTEVGPVTYTEIGFSPVVTPSTSVFSRILLSVPISIASGQRIRLVYQLNVSLTPTSPVSKTAAIGGWPVSPSVNTDGTEQVQGILTSVVLTDGTSFVTGACMDPADTAATTMFVSPSSAALAAIGGSVPDRSFNASACNGITKAAYTNGTYTIDKTGVFDVTQGNRTDLRSMGVSTSGGGSGGQPLPSSTGFTFLFSQVQAKANTQTLSLTFRYIWSRTLA
jgi:hypothetical protein